MKGRDHMAKTSGRRLLGYTRLLLLALVGMLFLPGGSLQAQSLPATTGAEVDAAARAAVEDARVDLALGVLEANREVLHLLASPPVSWRGPRGRQPFEQEPPQAQQDFRGGPARPVPGP